MNIIEYCRSFLPPGMQDFTNDLPSEYRPEKIVVSGPKQVMFYVA